jgi:hypothetical protein
MTDIDYHAAQQAAGHIQRLSDECWHALAGSCRAMADDAWVGPVGRRFKDDVEAAQRELQTQLAKAVQDAQAKLRSVPGKP